MEAIQMESGPSQPWAAFFPIFDTFLRSFSLTLPAVGVCNLVPLVRIMIQTLRFNIISSHKTIVESYSKILSLAIQQSPIPYEKLLELCSLCLRAFLKERDRFVLTRTVVFELYQATKFKTVLPDQTLLTLVQFVLQDAGGTLVPTLLTQGLKANSLSEIEGFSTSASECMKQYFNDFIDFISDIHALSRVEVRVHSLGPSILSRSL